LTNVRTPAYKWSQRSQVVPAAGGDRHGALGHFLAAGIGEVVFVTPS
jgi:hypothetical protein